MLMYNKADLKDKNTCCKNTLYSTILARNVLFFSREYKLQNFFDFIPIQLLLEILFLPIYFEDFYNIFLLKVFL